jgi:type IV pilus assembly protein PilV
MMESRKKIMALKSPLVLYRPFRVMNKNAGFTLIEVLIAMLVLAVGLLGLAGLQVTSLKNNQSAYNRSQATQLAYDMADRMRANVAGVTTYTTILPSAATPKANCTPLTPNPLGCSPTEMAENDLYQWNLAVINTLPMGVGGIAPTTGGFTIAISWDDNRDGSVNAYDPNFQMSFQL